MGNDMNQKSCFLPRVGFQRVSFTKNSGHTLRTLSLLCGVIGGVILTACESETLPKIQTTESSVAPEDCSIDLIREGEVCDIDIDLDRDLDGVPDAVDNCPDIANPPQSDCDLDEIGDLCDEEQACGAQLSGYVRLFQQGMSDSTPLRYGALELEGYQASQPPMSLDNMPSDTSLKEPTRCSFTLLHQRRLKSAPPQHLFMPLPRSLASTLRSPPLCSATRCSAIG